MDMDLFMQIMGGESRYDGEQAMTFTPPHIAKEMVDLLPDSVWNDKTTFLDLYCKTGVFLVEIYNRLDKALKMMPAYTDDRVRRTHILNEQLFGLSGSDGMPLLMSQRNLYGEIGVGNIRHIGADNMSYVDIIKQNDIDLLKGCLQREFGKMNFDVVIGNPPYNNDLYLGFVTLGNQLSHEYTCMITPAKWQAKGGERNKIFRKQIVPYMERIVYFPCVTDVFDITSVGGITYFLLTKTIPSSVTINIISLNQRSFHKNSCIKINKISDRCTYFDENLEQIVKCCIHGKRLGDFIFKDEHTGEYMVEVSHLVDDKRYSNCVGGYILTPLRLKPRGILTPNSYELYAGTKEECASFMSYVNTKLIRFLVALGLCASSTRNNETWRFVPAPPSGRFDHIYTDQELYKAFNLPQNYIDIIEAVIKERK